MPALEILQQQASDSATEPQLGIAAHGAGLLHRRHGRQQPGRDGAVDQQRAARHRFGLLDHQTNPAVDKWVGEKVLLSAATTRCTVPKGCSPAGRGCTA